MIVKGGSDDFAEDRGVEKIGGRKESRREKKGRRRRGGEKPRVEGVKKGGVVGVAEGQGERKRRRRRKKKRKEEENRRRRNGGAVAEEVLTGSEGDVEDERENRGGR